MKDRVRMNPDSRREQILSAALHEAERVGFANVCRKAIADRAGCSPGLVRHYWGTLPQLHRAIMGEAIRADNARVVAQGIVAKHPRCNKLNSDEKQRILSSL